MKVPSTKGRRRIQQNTLGHHGHTHDPLHRLSGLCDTPPLCLGQVMGFQLASVDKQQRPSLPISQGDAVSSCSTGSQTESGPPDNPAVA
jgi:hypothetical protein